MSVFRDDCLCICESCVDEALQQLNFPKTKCPEQHARCKTILAKPKCAKATFAKGKCNKANFAKAKFAEAEFAKAKSAKAKYAKAKCAKR